LDAALRKVLQLGMGPTAASALESLSARFEVLGVIRGVTDKDRSRDPVAIQAKALGVPLLTDSSQRAVGKAIEGMKPDCVIVSSFNRVLGASLLDQTRFVNVHYSPLPRYRGRANVNWAIINQEPEAAISIHTIAPGLDAGRILFQRRVLIGPDDYVGDLYSKLNDIQRSVLGDTVARHLDGYEGEPQDEEDATYGCTRVPEDGEIDWTQPVDRIYALVRALSDPYPGAHTHLAGRKLSIIKAAPLRDAPRFVGRIPGRVIARSIDDGYVDVLAGEGVMRLYEVATPEGPASAAEVITSTSQTLGIRTIDLLIRLEELQARLNQLEMPAALDPP
jgi:methionyl-tRNA formyltransferase